MTAPEWWSTSLVVRGGLVLKHDLPVVVELVETDAGGGVQIIVTAGEKGDPIALPLAAICQLVVNVRQGPADRFKITVEVDES